MVARAGGIHDAGGRAVYSGGHASREHMVVRPPVAHPPRRARQLVGQPQESALLEERARRARVEIAAHDHRIGRVPDLVEDDAHLVLPLLVSDTGRRGQVDGHDTDAQVPAVHDRRCGGTARARDVGGVGQQDLARLVEGPRREDGRAEVVARLRVDRAREVDVVHAEGAGNAVHAGRVHLLEQQDVRVAQRRAGPEQRDCPVNLARELDVERHDLERAARVAAHA